MNGAAIERMRIPNPYASLVGSAFTLIVTVGIFAGSRGLVHFDAALTGYAIGSLLAAFAVGYRFAIWASRPPSRMYFKRGFQLLFHRSTKAARSPQANHPATQLFNPSTARRLSHGAGTLGAALAGNFVAQNFIRRRSLYRWIMHLCLSGGCTLAFAITFPLVFGWIHFESSANDATM